MPDQLVISTENSKPIADAGPHQIGTVGTPVTLDGTLSSDVDNDPLSYVWSLLNKPANSGANVINSDRLQALLTPDLPGDYVAQLIVNDSKLNSDPATSLVTVSVATPINHQPQITTSPVLTATVGVIYSYDVNASDSDNDTLNYSLSVFPTGMAMAAQTGLISWTPGAGQIGPQAVNVSVSDGKGGSDSQSYTVTVIAAGQVTVPDLLNKSRAAAESAIQQAKLNVGALSFEHNAKADGSVTNQNPAANSSVAVGAAVNLTISLGPDQGLPPNPATVAPTLDSTVATNTFVATQFLYSGSNPIQTGVQPGIIVAKRAAVVHGKVLDKQNNPLSGVTVNIKDHAELGQTLSRADGQFDLVVNGGGLLTLNYRLTGYLKSQRQIQTGWQDYANLDDVVLIQADTKLSTLNLNDTTQAFQVAQGSIVNDARGSRTAELLIPQGTQASVLNPDGSKVSVNQLHLRMTEYTVGENGPKAMPGPLPPTSSYTYAVEITPDEAIAKVAGREVIFDRPVPYYVDNFLHMPIGIKVPVGYYDPDKSAWIPSPDGRVIKILSVVNGEAQVDSDGDAVADGGNSIGMTLEERKQLARLHVAGISLWRVPMTHLSTYDHNLGSRCTSNCSRPTPPPPPRPDPKIQHPCEQPGSIIECENQVLGETLPVTGTAYSLNYRSNRVHGRAAASNSIEIPVIGATIPDNLKNVLVEIHLAGRVFKPSGGIFSPSANFKLPFVWDGKDALGREVQGGLEATVRIGYQYDAVYSQPTSLLQSFGQASGLAIANADPAPDIVYWQDQKVDFGSWDAKKQGLGAWTLSNHHAYDPIGKTLLLGNGAQRSAVAQTGNTTITTVAGNGSTGFTEEGLLATNARMQPESVAVGADGSLYIANFSRISRVRPDGIITTFAGNGFVFSGDGKQAISTGLGRVTDVEIGVDGSLYTIGDFSRIFRVGPDGILTTVAGNGSTDYSGDGGPATSAGLGRATDVAVGVDGSLYIAAENNRIRRVGPDGIITTVAGNGTTLDSGDGGPATSAGLGWAIAVAVGADGSLYTVGFNNNIRRVGPDGIITTVAGNGTFGFTGDGGPAISAGMDPFNVGVGVDGSLYIVDDNARIRRVGPDGIITTVAGNGTDDYSGDGGSATSAAIRASKIKVGVDGSLYIVDFSHRIRRVGSSWPGFALTDQFIPAEDGSELYQFASGRHFKTINPLTSSVIEQFAYDTNGYLSSVTDANGNITTIERNAVGSPTAIVAPFGQRTTLGLDANGYLAQVSNPADESYQMSYTSDGLLTAFTDPRNNSSTISYEPGTGRLLSDTNATGAGQSLIKTILANGHEILHRTALNRTNTNRVEFLATGDQRRTGIQPDSTKTVTVNGTNGVNTTTLADGSVTVLAQSGDPRFGMLAPISASQKLSTGGLSSTATTSRAVTLATLNNSLSLTSLTDTFILNGRTSTSAYNAATKTFTNTSAAGRVSTSVLDSLGRLSSAQVSGLNAISNSYDPKGHLASTTQGANPDDRSVDFAYNPQGYLASVTDPLSRVVGYEYDAAGRVTLQTLPDGRQIQYGYDASGNLVSLQPPGKLSPHVFKYTSINQTSSYEPPPVPGVGNGNTTYVYDADRALSQITRPDGQTVNFNYDSAGRLSNQQLQPGNITLDSYSYHATTGKLSSITDLAGGKLSFTYSGALLTQTAWTGSVAGTVNATYDNDFRVISLTVNGSLAIAHTYDADSKLTKVGNLNLARNAQNGLLTGTTLGTVTDTRNYNGFGEVTAYTALVGASALLGEQYSYDKLGRITQKIETILGAAANTYAYGYNTAGRLTEVQKNGAVQASYAYDDNGNRLTRTALGAAINGSYDDQDRLSSYGNATYAYTDNGELLSKTVGASVTQYQYDVLGNLRHVDLPGGNVSTALNYIIDGQNRRVGKKVGGILRQGFLYQDSLKIIAELDGNNAIVSRFIYATHVNVPDTMIKGGITYRIITDHLGSPRLVVQVDGVTPGQVAQRMDYDEFGNVLADSNPGFQPFGFAGGLYDRDTKLVRFGARDYDANTGRWAVKDPISFSGGDTNLYGYVLSDPLNITDVVGTCPPKLLEDIYKKYDKIVKPYVKPIAKYILQYGKSLGEYLSSNVNTVSGWFTRVSGILVQLETGLLNTEVRDGVKVLKDTIEHKNDIQNAPGREQLKEAYDSID